MQSLDVGVCAGLLATSAASAPAGKVIVSAAECILDGHLAAHVL